MIRKNYFDYIEEKLNLFATQIESRSKLNLLDLNIHAEFFYRDLFNQLFGFHFRKTESPNEAGIDLLDRENKIVASVSSTATNKKISTSLSKASSNYQGYKFLFISISKNASSLRKVNFESCSGLDFNPKNDIYDINSVLEVIEQLDTSKLKDLYAFFQREFETSENAAPIDRLRIYLLDIDGWKKSENHELHYIKHPEFTITEDNNHDPYEHSYSEPWIYNFPAGRSANQHQYLIKYNNTTIADSLYIICCDDGRFMFSQPKKWIKETPDAWLYVYYFIEDSIEYKFGKLINNFLSSSNLRFPSFYEEMAYFQPDENVQQIIDDDLDSGKRGYIYYSFDKKSQQYSKICKGISTRLPA